MSVERYTLDTNILFYAVDSESGVKHSVARELVRAAYASDCVISLQALSELYNAVSRKKPQHLATATEMIHLMNRTLPIARSSSLDLFSAMEQQRVRPVHFWDAMLWATAGRSGCAMILTENLPDQSIVGGVRYLNPFTASPEELAGYLNG